YYARRRFYTKAMDVLQNALRIKQNDPAILSSIAELHLELNDLGAAEAAIERALANNKEHVQANFIKGRIYFLKKDYTNALGQFDLTLSKTPDHYMAYYYKAICLIEKGAPKYSGAELFRAAAGYFDDTDAWAKKLAKENLYKALELNPQLLGAKLILAEIYLHEQNTKEARRQIEEALALDPNYLQTLSLQGSLKILEGDFKGAEAVCKKVLESNPDLSVWHVRLGVVYKAMHRQDDALGAFQKALKLNSMQIDALELMVDTYLRTKKYEEALKVCAKQKKNVSSNRSVVAEIENLEGTIYVAMGEEQTARQYFENAVAGNPDYIAPRMALAGMYARQKEIDQAISQYEGVLAVNSEFLPACMALGIIHHQKGEPKQAEKYYRRALAIKSGYGPAANNLAFLLVTYTNKVNEALGLAQLAVKNMPRDANAKDTLGWIYYRTGNYYNAISWIEDSLKLDPDNALTNYHLGLAYYKNNEFEKARGHIKKALALDPNFEGADEARTMLD
ncbi:MAG: tetratricopeptide repeat protein, partial [Proteobacteria bacterium]|nr:tetratricopeptide repeat protein [Pseudomonadota bacterium]